MHLQRLQTFKLNKHACRCQTNLKTDCCQFKKLSSAQVPLCFLYANKINANRKIRCRRRQTKTSDRIKYVLWWSSCFASLAVELPRESCVAANSVYNSTNMPYTNVQSICCLHQIFAWIGWCRNRERKRKRASWREKMYRCAMGKAEWDNKFHKGPSCAQVGLEHDSSNRRTWVALRLVKVAAFRAGAMQWEKKGFNFDYEERELI